MHPVPPKSAAELLRRAQALQGMSLAELAAQAGLPIPPDERRAKGWAGNLIENLLGATAGSQARPDFPHLGIELKTVPIDEQGSPRESTYVCTAPMDARSEPTWAQCWVRRKLSWVLWLPMLEAPSLRERRVGPPLLWRPSAQEDAILREDWEELRELLALGEYGQIDGRRGRALQLRPKAASSRTQRWVLDTEGERVQANPLGFYLRPGFTRVVLGGG